jgi:hypothetical protein
VVEGKIEQGDNTHLRFSRINSTAAKAFMPLSIRAMATNTGALESSKTMESQVVSTCGFIACLRYL